MKYPRRVTFLKNEAAHPILLHMVHSNSIKYGKNPGGQGLPNRLDVMLSTRKQRESMPGEV